MEPSWSRLVLAAENYRYWLEEKIPSLSFDSLSAYGVPGSSDPVSTAGDCRGDE